MANTKRLFSQATVAKTNSMKPKRMRTSNLTSSLKTTMPSSMNYDTNWSDTEDSRLRDAVLKYPDEWPNIRDYLCENKDVRYFTVEECERRWTEVVSQKHKKGPWTDDEDKLVCELVRINGPKKWSTLAAYVPGRTGKQCRERWVNHLSPDVNKGEWTEEEERILIREHDRLGNQWCKIAQTLPGRSENAVKNRWNSFANRCLSHQKGDGSMKSKSKMKKMKSKMKKKRNCSSNTTLSHEFLINDILDSLTSPKITTRKEEKILLQSQSPKPASSMINIRRRLAKPLFINPRIDLLEDDSSEITDFDSLLLSPELSPMAMCISPSTSCLLSPISPQSSLRGFNFSPLSSMWPKSPIIPTFPAIKSKHATK